MKSVSDAEFIRVIQDPQARALHYKPMVQTYFNGVTEIVRQNWGESFHFAVFSGSEPVREAIAATERWIADEGGFRPGMKVLDVGCGVGGPALHIARHSGVDVTGINLVERQIKLARRRAEERDLSGRVRFLLADAMQMPFAQDSFDGLFLFDAARHMPDKPVFFRECARVLKPGGPFVGLDWIRKEGLTAQEEERWIEPLCRLHSIPGLPTLRELRGYMEAAGLEVEAMEDAATRGNILRNWEMLEDKRAVLGSLLATVSPVLRMLVDGGKALLEAARAGAFVMGYWRARKKHAQTAEVA